MALSDADIKGCVRRLMLSKLRLMNTHGFYGLLLAHMQYALDESIETACTDGKRILFNPDFLENLSETELDFVMMHEILHVVLRHCQRRGEREAERFNIACDIVVNSIILQECGGNLSAIYLSKYGVAMHLAPGGKEGRDYTAEQVYELLHSPSPMAKDAQWDDHSQWQLHAGDDGVWQVWEKHFADACEAIRVREKVLGTGQLPEFARRIFEALHAPQIDWRTILNEFVQQEICDYSFSPPDRRYGDTPFFLPDFNELGDCGSPADILFMIDTSGSMTDREITAAYSEIKGAIDQYGGSLTGWLGFFDAAVIPPVPFENVEDVLQIKPAGGGGTNFHSIFDYVRNAMEDTPPACIIIMTDGYAAFPQETAAQGIPTLWLLNNKEITPPWGKIARIEIS